MCGDAPHFAALEESRKPAEIALKQRYCQLNPRNRLGVIVIDLDHTSGSIWNDAPPPTYSTLNPASGHQQAGYILAQPVARGGRAHPGPQRYADDVRQALTRELGGDTAFSGLISRGPFHADHVTRLISGKLYTLGELLKDLPPTTTTRREAEKIADISIIEGRNCAMFDTLRLKAYEMDGTDLRSYAETVNKSFDIPLNQRELESIVKSVSKWVGSKYQPAYKGSPRARIHSRNRERLSEAQQQARRQAGQAQGAATKQEATRATIAAGVAQLQAQGSPITAASLQIVTNLSKKAIYAHSDIWQG